MQIFAAIKPGYEDAIHSGVMSVGLRKDRPERRSFSASVAGGIKEVDESLGKQMKVILLSLSRAPFILCWS